MKAAAQHTRAGLAASALALIVACFSPSPAHSQTLYVTTDQTVATRNPITGTYRAVNVGIDERFKLYPGVHADVLAQFIQFNLTTFSDSITNVAGGSIGSIVGRGDSTINLFAGRIQATALTDDSSTLNINGGLLISGFTAFGDSTINVSGGTFGSDSLMNVWGNGDITFFGTGLRLSAPIPGTLGIYQGNFYTLTGRLTNNQSDSAFLRLFDATNFVDAGTEGLGGRFVITNLGIAAPEPPTLALLVPLLTGLMLASPRRSARMVRRIFQLDSPTGKRSRACGVYHEY